MHGRFRFFFENARNLAKPGSLHFRKKIENGHASALRIRGAPEGPQGLSVNPLDYPEDPGGVCSIQGNDFHLINLF